MDLSITFPARSTWRRVIGPNLLVLLGRGAAGALPVAAMAFASHAYGLAAMGGLATALMLAYGTAEIADAQSQRHVSRLLRGGSADAADALAAFNSVRVLALAIGLLASAAVLRSVTPESGWWAFLVLATAIWSTVVNMDYAVALAHEDYTAIAVGPVAGLAALVVALWALEQIRPAAGIVNLCVAINVARIVELGWLRRRQAWPGLSRARQAVIDQWNATRYLLAQAFLSAFNVRLAVPFVAILGGVSAAGIFSIGLSLLSIVSLAAVAITVPAYRRAVTDGPLSTLREAWQRTRRDFVFCLLVCGGLVLVLWAVTPWVARTMFDVHEAAIHALVRVVVLGGLFEALTLFASVWFHACVRDRQLFALSVATAVGGWMGIAAGEFVAGASGMVWGFTLSRAAAVLALYAGLWPPRARHAAAR